MSNNFLFVKTIFYNLHNISWEKIVASLSVFFPITLECPTDFFNEQWLMTRFDAVYDITVGLDHLNRII